MNHGIAWLTAAGLLILAGCMSLFHPEVEEFYTKAKGPNAQQSALTLLSMMETSAQQAKTEHGASQALENLHNQFHAFHKTFCDFSELQRATTSYEQSVTLKKEMKTIFHRLWDFKQDTSLRNAHLDLFLARIQELRTSVQAIPGLST